MNSGSRLLTGYCIDRDRDGDKVVWKRVPPKTPGGSLKSLLPQWKGGIPSVCPHREVEVGRAGLRLACRRVDPVRTEQIGWRTGRREKTDETSGRCKWQKNGVDCQTCYRMSKP